MKARKVFLLIVVLSFGLAVETAWTIRQNIGIGPLGCRVLRGKFYGPSFSFEEQEVRKLAAGAAVEVENSFGAVRTVQGSEGEVRVSLRKVVYLPTEEEARAFASRIRLVAGESGPAFKISTNRDQEERRISEVGFETHLEITLPPGTALKVRNEHGRVEVSDVARAEVTSSFEGVRVERVAGDAILNGRHGDVSASAIGGTLSLTSRHGNVDVQDVQGMATVQLQHGDISAARTGGLTVVLAHGGLEARDVRGPLEFKGEHAGVQAEEVSGRTQVETGHRSVRLSRMGGDVRVKNAHGEVQVEDVKGGLVVDASFDQVSLARIAGPVDVTISHGGLKAEALERGARVKSSGDDVVLDRFRGPVEIEAQRGSVELIPDGALTDTVSVSTRNGGIRLEVPSGSRFRLEASTRRGDLEIDVPGLTVTMSERDRLAGEIGGGGNSVRLTASHGDVKVAAGASVAAKAP